MQLQVRLRLHLAGEHEAGLRQRPQDLLLPVRYENGGLPAAAGAAPQTPRALSRLESAVERAEKPGRSMRDKRTLPELTCSYDLACPAFLESLKLLCRACIPESRMLTGSIL